MGGLAPWLRRRVGRGVKAVLWATGGPAGGLRVLAYHSVDPSGSLLSVRPDQLRRHLLVLKRGGWRGLTAAEFTARLHGPPAASREVLITFDDGYENFLTDAAPILADLGFPATVFVVTDSMGEKPRWFERDREAIDRLIGDVPFTTAERRRWATAAPEIAATRLLDWAQARELVARGFDVQSHGAEHRFLTRLPSDAVTADLARSRAALERELGVAPRLFCYPYGDADARVAAIARDLGFDGAVLAEYDGPWSDPFHVGRVTLNGATDAFDLRVALSPAIDHQAALRRRVRRLLAGRGRRASC
jgi:peptidoglycan/xylan/chitin deacetylase (PgdA/CDA1 family)